jgi:putative cell wall-binding protein
VTASAAPKPFGASIIVTHPARRIFSSLVALALIAALAAPAGAVDGDRFVALTNQKRAEVKLPPVSLHAAVDQISVERANHMARHDDFRHDMTYVANRLKALGVCYRSYGEIIAWNTNTNYDPSQSITQWWNSSGHRAIMTGNFNVAGGSHARSTATKRNYAVMVFVLTCSGTAKTTQITRMAGSDRYATAAAVSKSRFPAGAPTVFVATGIDFPDALAAAPAAAKAKAPILLTTPTQLPSATATELARLKPSKIIVVGGKGAVSDTVLGQLRSYAGTVARWAGADRFATAATISASSFGTGGVAYIATGGSFPDALSGGATAGKIGGPILLATRDGIPAATASELRRLKPSSIVVFGGSGVVSDGVVAQLKGFSPSVTRLAGQDRFGTSVAISKSAYANGSTAVFVATGSNFPDGLAGGPVAALLPGPLLLVGQNRLPDAVKLELGRLGPGAVHVLGGSGAVSDGVVNAIRNALP